MTRLGLKILVLSMFAFGGAAVVNAQYDPASRSPSSTRQNGSDDDLPTNVQETLAKQRIEREKKDFQELVDRSAEAVKLSDELEKSVESKNSLTGDDQRKLDRLEKLVKKIRSELGADGDGTADDDDRTDDAKKETPSNLVSATKSLQSKALQLLDEVKKSTRYSVSVVSIQTSNALLKLVKFIRLAR